MSTRTCFSFMKKRHFRSSPGCPRNPSASLPCSPSGMKPDIPGSAALFSSGTGCIREASGIRNLSGKRAPSIRIIGEQGFLHGHAAEEVPHIAGIERLDIRGLVLGHRSLPILDVEHLGRPFAERLHSLVVYRHFGNALERRGGAGSRYSRISLDRLKSFRHAKRCTSQSREAH